jgi:hypothetical protein
MQIAFHIGVHCTDDERLLRSLLRSRGQLAPRGVTVPLPSRYRTLLRDTAVKLNGQVASPDTAALIAEEIADEGATRIVLGWENFAGFPNWAIRGGLYPAAAERLRAFRNIFPGSGFEVFMAIRNPAALAQGLVPKLRDMTVDQFLAAFDPEALSWSTVVAGLRRMVPDAPVTIWCDEDAPVLWPDILRAIADLPDDIVPDAADARVADIMRPEGFQRLQAYLSDKGHLPPARRRKVVLTFLEKFALAEHLTMDIDLPGWTPALVDRMTEAYHADMVRIAAIDGVRLLRA